jgi:hypothetical protein
VLGLKKKRFIPEIPIKGKDGLSRDLQRERMRRGTGKLGETEITS